MEVHHHSRLASGETHTSRKKWTHYFWEFLMLFLAVFCGFLAEYQLEHVIEHNKEKQFIKALVEDLKLDTMGMRRSSELSKRQIMGMDTLTRMIWDSSITRKNARRVYELKFTYTGGFSRVIFSRSTLTQLKNSGNLRLIRNMAITDNILKYDLSCDRTDRFASNIENYITSNYEAEYSIFNDKFWPDNYKSEEAYENADFDLLTYDAKTLISYAGRIAHQKVAMETYTNRIIPGQKKLAEQLITTLRKEYHLSEGIPLEK